MLINSGPDGGSPDGGCGRDTFLAAYDTFSTEILKKSAYTMSFGGSTLTADGGTLGGTLTESTVQSQLSRMGNWYVHNRTRRFNQGLTRNPYGDW